MKIEKSKHNHTLTHLLKVGIFAMLMLAPLFAACSKMIYVTCNKNAKDSYYGETTNEETLIDLTTSNFQNNITYYFDSKKITAQNILNLGINASNTTLYIENITVIANSLNLNFEGLDKFNFYSPVDNNRCYFYGYDANNNALFTTQQIIDNDIRFSFTYKNGSIDNDFLNNTKSFYYYEYNKNSYLDNAFYYGVETMTESTLFNWTQNTALYTGIKAMTDNLEIQTNVIAVLVTYWTILTIIYIIIDIVLAIFTKLTHLLVRSD